MSACRWFGKFIPDLAHTTAPLNNLLRKNVPFNFSPEYQEAFDLLKQKLCEAPILAQPDFDKSFRLYTDASREAMDAVLVQREEGEERVIEYASKQFNPAQKNYSVIEREALAVIWAIIKFRPYIDRLHSVIHSDHWCILDHMVQL